MGQDPDAIRREIDQTRENMSETVEALGYRADVPARAKDSIQDKVGSVRERITGVAGSVSDATPDGQQVAQGARQAVGVAQANPLGLAVGSLAAGFLIGMLVPETRVEHEKLGPAADEVKGQVASTAQEAVDHGRQAAQEVARQTLDTARETAQQAAQEHGQQLGETAQQNAEQAATAAREQVGG
jgi:hypothetical protein